MIDPHCRGLSDGKINIAKKYFSDRINYKNVKVFDRAFMLVAGRNSSGISPNGHLYFAHADDYSPNYANTPEITPFIHS